MLGVVAYGQEIYFVILEKLVVSAIIVIDTHPQHNYAFTSIALLQLFEGWHLFDAWRTPSCPKIKDDDLAAKIVQSNLVVGVLNREIRGGGADVGRPRSAIASA